MAKTKEITVKLFALMIILPIVFIANAPAKLSLMGSKMKKIDRTASSEAEANCGELRCGEGN